MLRDCRGLSQHSPIIVSLHRDLACVSKEYGFRGIDNCNLLLKLRRGSQSLKHKHHIPRICNGSLEAKEKTKKSLNSSILVFINRLDRTRMVAEFSFRRWICRNRKDSKKLLLLNLLAALYGLGNVMSKFVDNAAPGTPASLTSAVKYTSASLIFLPSLVRCFKCNDRAHIKAGVELGLWTFAHGILASCSPSSTDPNATSLLYALTACGMPLLQLCAGRSSKVTWLAILSVLFGMGLLEEEGNGWKGILLPSFGNAWAVLEAAFSVLQIFRSEALGKDRDPVKLNGIQLAVLSILNVIWELSHLSSSTGLGGFIGEAQTIPWCHLIFSGLVCAGLGTLLEIRGLKGVDGSALTINYMMIPVWGAFFSLLQQGRSPQEVTLLSSVVLMFARFCTLMSSHPDDRNLESRSDRMKLAKQRPEDSKFEGHLPVVILSCQLKFPYYANQAQALLIDMDSNVNSSLLHMEAAAAANGGSSSSLDPSTSTGECHGSALAGAFDAHQTYLQHSMQIYGDQILVHTTSEWIRNSSLLVENTVHAAASMASAICDFHPSADVLEALYRFGSLNTLTQTAVTCGDLGRPYTGL